jgi:hypothetical protein
MDAIQEIPPPSHLISAGARNWSTDDTAKRRQIVRKGRKCRVVQHLENVGVEAFENELRELEKKHEAKHELVLRIEYADYVRLLKAAFSDMLEVFAEEIQRDLTTDDVRPDILEEVKIGDGKEPIEEARNRVRRRRTIKDAVDRDISPAMYEGQWMKRKRDQYRFTLSTGELAKRGIHEPSLPKELEAEFHATTTLGEALQEVSTPEIPPEPEWGKIERQHAERRFRIRIARTVLTAAKENQPMECKTRSDLPATSDKARKHFWAVYDTVTENPNRQWKTLKAIRQRAARRLGKAYEKERIQERIRKSFAKNEADLEWRHDCYEWSPPGIKANELADRVVKIGEPYDWSDPE